MPKNLIVIVVYDRLHNLKQWFHCWDQCNQSAQLVVIHNAHGEAYTYDIPPGVIYIHRPNIGYDIGAFQDVCRGRLFGFPTDWDNMLWVTDDTLPMQKDFADLFWAKLEPDNVGVVCMELSPYVKQHIRTTGFALKVDVAARLQFPVDPIETKHQCYEFEHLSRAAFLEQVTGMGYKTLMVTANTVSPLYDMGYLRRIKHREALHYSTFGRPANTTKEPGKVVFICPAFNSYPFIINSLLQQTYNNWELYIIHDGPNKTGLKEQVASFKDDRIFYDELPERSMNWGHQIRSEWLHKVSGDFVVITNQDNYHVPVYIEYMVKAFTDNIIAAYCGSMVHSHIAWGVIPCHLERGYVDCAGVMVRLKQAQEVGWNDITSHSADWFYFADIIKAYGINKFVKVPGCLLIHN